MSNKVLGGVIWAMVRSWGGRLTNLAVFMVVVRVLQPAELGVFAFVAAIITILMAISEMGLSEYVVYRKHDDESCSRVFFLQLAVAFFWALLTFIFAPILLHAIGRDAAIPAIEVLCWIIPLSALMGVQDALQKRQLEFKKIALRQLCGSLAGGLVGVLLALSGAGVWALVAKFYIEVGVATVLLWSLSDWRPRWVKFWQGSAEIFEYARHMSGSQLLDIIVSNLDELLVGAVLGEKDLGIYSVGKKLFQLFAELIKGVTTQVAGPMFATQSADPLALKNMYLKAVGHTALLAVPIYALLAIFVSDLVPLLFGARWTAAVPLMQIFCLAGMLIPLSQFCVPALLAAGSSKTGLLYSLISTTGGVLFMLLGVSWALIGVPLAFLLRLAWSAGLTQFFLTRQLPLSARALLHSLRPAIISTLLLIATALLLQQLLPLSGALGFVLRASACALLLLILWWFLLFRHLRSGRSKGANVKLK